MSSDGFQMRFDYCSTMSMMTLKSPVKFCSLKVELKEMCCPPNRRL